MAVLGAAVTDDPVRVKDRRLQVSTIDIGPSCRAALATTLTIEGKPDVTFDRAVLLMSATVGTPGAKTYTVDRLGIEVDGLLEVPTPLDHRKQMRVSVIRNVNRLPWGSLVSGMVNDVGGRTLVLMRSWRRVEEVYDALRRETGYPIYCQDRESPSRNAGIMAAFKETPDSVLVGTRSFFEGVDPKGDTCVQVIIGDLPVPMVFTPLDRERQARVGLTTWLNTVRVHETAVVLEQMIGRLIRSVDDRGVVGVLDQTAQKGWGQQALGLACKSYGIGLTDRVAAMKFLESTGAGVPA